MHSHRYRITIEGNLGRVGRAAFEEFNIASNDGHTSLVADLDPAGPLRHADPHPVTGSRTRGAREDTKPGGLTDDGRRSDATALCLAQTLPRTRQLPDLVTVESAWGAVPGLLLARF
jgi:hypothetical protein